MIVSLLALAMVAAQPAPPPPSLQSSIKNYFDVILLDGASARWKWPVIRKKSVIYCGWVNAKNSYGAYTGWKPFYVLIEGGKVSHGHVYGSSSLEVNDEMLVTLCAKNGFDVGMKVLPSTPAPPQIYEPLPDNETRPD